MKTYTIQCVLLIATVSLFAQGQGSSSVLNTENANVTFECDCSKVNDSNADLTASQTTYHCACQTYLESGQARRACFYNCSKENYTCEVNEFCENLTFCNRSCHEYATCVYKNESYGKYECVCNEGFRATGNGCLPKTGCAQSDCGNVTEPKLNCSCKTNTYCCSTDDECPTNCSNCNEEPCFKNFTQERNLTCWCKDSCYRAAEVKFENSSYSVREDVRELNVKIILTGNITSPVHVRLDTNNVAANSGKDYEIVNKTKTFYPNASNGRQEIHVPILIYNDDLVENNETFSVTLSSKSLPKLVAADPNGTTITIIDNDVAFVSFQRSNYLVAEGDNEVTVSVILTGNITIPVHARLVIRNASAEVGNDFNTPMDTDITFSSNDTKVVDVSFTILNDNVVEENETFSVTLSSRNWSSLAVADPNSTIITIVDNDIDGNFTDWSVWGDCSRSCGIGSQQRTRTCTNPEPKGEGKNCTVIGNSTEIQSCNNSLICPMISNWSNWTPCSVTCGKGNVTRFCLNNTGYGCNGTLNETKDCDLGACPVDGYFNEWGSWAKCSKTCGNGVKSRTRKCIEPQNNGKNCSGLYNDTSECSNPAPCPGEEGFGLWSDWSECSVTCLQGIQSRQRTCNDDTNVTCQGDYRGSQTCDMGPCPVNGYWSGWGEWSLCPGSCGSSFVERQRKCDNPPPKYRGRNCTGNPTEVKGCNHSKVCDGESGFTQWSEWSPCSATCGNGVEVRTRKCNEYYAPSECNSTYSQNKSCYHEPCPVANFSSWSNWTSCNESCYRSRNRKCLNTTTAITCNGTANQIQRCNESCEVISNWSNWTSCSVTCGKGNVTRFCLNNTGYGCNGTLNETRDCDLGACPVNGYFTEWGSWTKCSKTCGNGVKSRTRKCIEPQNNGKNCSGLYNETSECSNPAPCPDIQHSAGQLVTPYPCFTTVLTSVVLFVAF